MNFFDALGLIKGNKFVKPDSKISKQAIMMAGLSPDMLGSAMTTGGINPAEPLPLPDVQLNLRDYEMDANGLQPKQDQKSAINLEQPKQYQNRLAENKSSDLSSKDLVRGLLKGLGAAVVGGAIGGDTGVMVAGKLMNKIQDMRARNKMEQQSKLLAQAEMERQRNNQARQERELQLKRDEMGQRSFNQGLGKVLEAGKTGIQKVYDLLRPETASEKIKRMTSEQRLENLKEQGQNMRRQGQKLDMQMAGTLPRAGKSGGSRGGSAKPEKIKMPTPDEWNAMSEEDKQMYEQFLSQPQVVSLDLRGKAKGSMKGNKQGKGGKRQPADEEAKLSKEMDREMLKWRIANPNASAEEEAQQLNNVRKAYAPLVNRAKANKRSSSTPAALPPAADAFLEALKAE